MRSPSARAVSADLVEFGDVDSRNRRGSTAEADRSLTALLAHRGLQLRSQCRLAIAGVSRLVADVDEFAAQLARDIVGLGQVGEDQVDLGLQDIDRSPPVR